MREEISKIVQIFFQRESFRKGEYICEQSKIDEDFRREQLKNLVIKKRETVHFQKRKQKPMSQI